MPQSGRGGFTVRPNPVPSGGTVEVSGKPGSVIYWRVDGRAGEGWNKVPLDGEGKGKIDVPSGSQSITVSDLRIPPQSVSVEVVSQNP